MKFVKPSYEILPLPDATDKMGVLKHLERIGRVCYKSEDKITDDSCIKYLENIKSRKHWAMLEHYVFVLSVPELIYKRFLDIVNRASTSLNPELKNALRFINYTEYDNPYVKINPIYKYLISGSATAFNYLWEALPDWSYYGENFTFTRLLFFLYDKYPEIIKPGINFKNKNNVEEFNDLMEDYYKHEKELVSSHTGISFLNRAEIESLPTPLRLIHDSISIKYVSDRAIINEMERHRPCSWAQESTRYVNYGKHGCEFILPCWLSDEDKEILMNDKSLAINTLLDNIDEIGLSPAAKEYVKTIFGDATSYEKLLNEYKWIPQEARSVLPLITKAEVVQTCNLFELRHFFKMRIPSSAHPQMRELTIPLFDELVNDPKMRSLFEDLSFLKHIPEIN